MGMIQEREPVVQGERTGGKGTVGEEGETGPSSRLRVNSKGENGGKCPSVKSGHSDEGCAFGPHSFEIVGVQGKQTVNSCFLSCPCNQAVINDTPGQPQVSHSPDDRAVIRG